MSKEIYWSKADDGYDYAFTTGPRWSGAEHIIGRIEFAREDGSYNSSSGLILGDEE